MNASQRPPHIVCAILISYIRTLATSRAYLVFINLYPPQQQTHIQRVFIHANAMIFQLQNNLKEQLNPNYTTLGDAGTSRNVGVSVTMP